MGRVCEMCTTSPAVLYCEADTCYLCRSCDEEVHHANRLARRHVRRPIVSADNEQDSASSDLLVPDVAIDPPSRTVTSADDLEDMLGIDSSYAEFDDFDGAPFCKMPPLSPLEADDAFLEAQAPGLKGLDNEDTTWDALIPAEFEHVVPDVLDMSGHASSKPAPVVVKNEAVAVSNAKLVSRVAAKPCAIVAATAKADGQSTSSVTASLTDSPTTEVTSFAYDTPVPLPTVEDLVKTAEQRRQIRQEALARFRSKRANRSFQKKIRYNCRKMLADSRPRVKGRFVKKSEMALYRRFGASYREHLPDIAAPVDMPAL